jgi:hypothetical protein
MKRINIFPALFLLGLVTGCGAPVRIFSDVDKSADFEQYQTYNFLDFTEGNKKTITGMELERVRVAFAREIEQRGLKFSAGEADVSFQITVYHRQNMDPYYYHSFRYTYMERALAVDMYDNRARKHIWHCAAVGELESDPEQRAEQLPEIVAEIFQRYPGQPPVAGDE